ncbi:Lysine exporter protein (LYSE/YGGA) [Cellulomonas flavigena DSM 20109]|uniref:Lysine exporter protein (LYSE/YGGA) n=1 Tax=Cellulomonas flavigena (strain ATCC 482 / DSM 20109 / BCRC 11376 / JCM 18109 / NBRC 3775 / NCIMB 8073 / NRS 134) TaxID=446466 RepID=D5UCV7_CELFN|nr:LysE family transporter [Cellulomonas flavigena]ADG76342.1 Lysine exporter protein (LYSE/YGGA) [Cellulomonas flavigena DSM 20109]
MTAAGPGLDLGPALLGGLLAGWGIAVPVGAVGVLLVLLGAHHGRRVGCAGAMGAAVVDGVYATLAVVLGSALAPVLVRAAAPVRWTAAVVLVVVAVLLLRPALRPSDAGPSPAAPDAPGMTPSRAFTLVVAATALNPATVVYFVALTSGAATTTLTTPAHRVAFVLAAFAASASWQLLLGSAGAWAGARLTGPRGRRWTAVVGALVVLALALRTALAG